MNNDSQNIEKLLCEKPYQFIHERDFKSLSIKFKNMKVLIRMIKIFLLSMFLIMAFYFSIKQKTPKIGETESFYKYHYSELYFEQCRKKYENIYENDGKEFDWQTVEKSQIKQK